MLKKQVFVFFVSAVSLLCALHCGNLLCSAVFYLNSFFAAERGTSMRQATSSALIPDDAKRFATAVIGSPTSIMCPSGSQNRTTLWPHLCSFGG